MLQAKNSASALYWRAARSAKNAIRSAKRIRFILKVRPIRTIFKKIIQLIGLLKNEIKSAVIERSNIKKLNAILAGLNNPIMIYPPYHDFDIPLYQRPQHLSMSLSAEFCYLFFSNNATDDVSHIRMIKDNLFLLPKNLYHYTLNRPFSRKKILFLYSNPLQQWEESFIENFMKDKNLVIYDYLDDLNNEIFGHVDDESIRKHQYILGNTSVILLVTADALLQDAKKYRSDLTNTYFIPNAVDLNKFSQRKNRVNELSFLDSKKVIGYFGALASWLDYALIKKIATHYSQYTLLLLGLIYDKTFRTMRLDKLPNIIVKGPIKYNDLPDYANYFDISIIPFAINKTTVATSPIKLFEYMALGKPIITTDLPECRKYKSALVAKDHDEFLSLVDQALKISKDSEYFKIMKQEAEENTWEARAKLIMNAINENFNTQR